MMYPKTSILDSYHSAKFGFHSSVALAFRNPNFDSNFYELILPGLDSGHLDFG
ncbi:hypothetical protein Pfo_010871 [Paulownia fortunei]|nr:hypothetical protein Pfo_010871 [Paulownia fortunei]